MIIKADATYRDVGQLLNNAQRQQQLAGFHAEARRLYRAEQCAAVVKIGEQLHILEPAAADPDGLVSAARAQLASVSQYSRGLHLLDTGEWQQAIEALEPLCPTYRDTAALLARARQEPPTRQRHQHRRNRPPSPSTPKRYRSCVTAKRSTRWCSAPDGHWLATVSDDKNARIWVLSDDE